MARGDQRQVTGRGRRLPARRGQRQPVARNDDINMLNATTYLAGENPRHYKKGVPPYLAEALEKVRRTSAVISRGWKAIWAPVAATPVRIAEPSMPETEPATDNLESDFEDSELSGSFSADSLDGGECIPATAGPGCSRYVLPTLPPIPRLEDVPCFFQQLDLDEEGACDDPLKSGMCNDYNTDGGAELRVDHRMRNRDAVQTAIKNYNIRRNAEYRVIESDRTKYHCRCKHAEDGCLWRIRVALRHNLGYW
ncbi:hypothetical protein PIB30_018572 [Stylosanthes scabra]|uniref:Transposase MuDR plant domain-containing protein n=1 Tax=Stylosanthes scabra TaxID=79078 RepID=A0ABU6R894_9FABA|nr:hypothetical protein [Stylosanthes scabra]